MTVRYNLADYIVGDLVRVSVLFMLANAPADPSTVVLKWKNPAGIITTWTYLTNVQLIKDSTGQYHADLDLLTSGTWNFRWEGTGTAQAAGQGSFVAAATNM